MASQNNQTDQKTPSFDSSSPTVNSCRRKKNFGAGSFVSDLRDHMYEFLHASADEHRTCFRDTFRKLLEMRKASSEKKSSDKIGGESSIPLQTTISD